MNMTIKWGCPNVMVEWIAFVGFCDQILAQNPTTLTTVECA